jgi:hypothetical protein
MVEARSGTGRGGGIRGSHDGRRSGGFGPSGGGEGAIRAGHLLDRAGDHLPADPGRTPDLLGPGRPSLGASPSPAGPRGGDGGAWRPRAGMSRRRRSGRKGSGPDDRRADIKGIGGISGPARDGRAMARTRSRPGMGRGTRARRPRDWPVGDSKRRPPRPRPLRVHPPGPREPGGEDDVIGRLRPRDGPSFGEGPAHRSGRPDLSSKALMPVHRLSGRRRRSADASRRASPCRRS